MGYPSGVGVPKLSYRDLALSLLIGAVALPFWILYRFVSAILSVFLYPLKFLRSTLLKHLPTGFIGFFPENTRRIIDETIADADYEYHLAVKDRRYFDAQVTRANAIAQIIKAIVLQIWEATLNMVSDILRIG